MGNNKEKAITKMSMKLREENAPAIVEIKVVDDEFSSYMERKIQDDTYRFSVLADLLKRKKQGEVFSIMTKKIINNRMYNTETAKQLGYWSNGYTPSDFYFAEETLYQKKTGEYFLVGHGGPMSSYAESCAGQSCSGTIFNPFTEEDAKKWAMDRLDADAYIALFGEVEE